jgi:hypothetical protein
MSQTKDIRDAVERELSYDPAVDDSDISVKNINGDVALNGTVPTYPQYVEAAAAARRVTGVKNVQNHLEVVLPSRSYRDDPTLTTTANNALLLNVEVPAGVVASHRRLRRPRRTVRHRLTGGSLLVPGSATDPVDGAAGLRAVLA